MFKNINPQPVLSALRARISPLHRLCVPVALQLPQGETHFLTSTIGISFWFVNKFLVKDVQSVFRRPEDARCRSPPGSAHVEAATWRDASWTSFGATILKNEEEKNHFSRVFPLELGDSDTTLDLLQKQMLSCLKPCRHFPEGMPLPQSWVMQSIPPISHLSAVITKPPSSYL